MLTLREAHARNGCYWCRLNLEIAPGVACFWNVSPVTVAVKNCRTYARVEGAWASLQLLVRAAFWRPPLVGELATHAELLQVRDL